MIVRCALFLTMTPAICRANEGKAAAHSPRIVNIINFVRQCEPRIDRITEDVLYDTVVSQIKILALDIGKFNTVYCDYICENGEHKFGKVKTTPQAIHDLIVVKHRRSIRLAIRAIFSAQGITGVPRGKSVWTKEWLGWLRKPAQRNGCRRTV